MSDGESDVAERLMGALISKMENMDNELQILKSENAQFRAAFNDPAVMLRKAGFVQARTRRPADVVADPFRGEGDEFILKGFDGESIVAPESNADFHAMDWSDIHQLAGQAKSVGAIGNQVGME
jgi:hypothetical protein|tara:strand:+ start:4990 stop:5361 length:372 start_codon:yes stop_codon:yes gene_type:complete